MSYAAPTVRVEERPRATLGMLLVLLPTSTLLGATVAATYTGWCLAFAPGLVMPLEIPSGLLVGAVGGALLLLAIRWRAPLEAGVLAAGAPLLAWPFVPARLPLISPVQLPGLLNLLWNAGERDLATDAVSVGAATAAGSGAIALLALRRRSPTLATVAHGSARWAGRADLVRAGLLGRGERDGIVLGSWRSRWGSERLVDTSDQHVLVLMPPRLGKTSQHVIPTLLTSRTSAAVLDPKGELWTLTSGWRSSAGHQCIQFAPTQKTARWNPLDTIPRGPGDVAVARDLALNLVAVSAHREEHSHWTAAARGLFALLALHVVHAPELDATVAQARSLLGAEDSHDDLFERLASHPHDPEGRRGWRDPRTGEPTPTHPEVSLLAHKYRQTPERERGSIVSTLQQHLDLWGDPAVARATAASDFHLSTLLRPEPATLYMSIPFADLPRVAPLVRLLLAALVREVTLRDTTRPGDLSRLEVILDEAKSLGRLPVVEDMLAYLPGYGLRATLLFQDKSQITKLYGSSESITGTCQVHVASATQQLTTRQHLSRLTGEATLRYPRRSRSHRGGFLGRGQTTLSTAETRRPLLTEGEVGSLPTGQVLVFKARTAPILADSTPYFEDRVLRRRSEIPPAASGGAGGAGEGP